MTASLKDRQILVVEDDALLAEDLCLALLEAGAIPLGPVGDISMALSRAAEQRADAALLDINLGGQLAYPVADIFRERGVPFIFLTGYEKSSIPGDYRAFPYLNKPVDNRSVLDALGDLLTGSGQDR